MDATCELRPTSLLSCSRSLPESALVAALHDLPQTLQHNPFEAARLARKLDELGFDVTLTQREAA